MIKLLKDINLQDLKFAPVRKTPTGIRIIDINHNVSYQTCWSRLVNDIEYSLCIDPGSNSSTLQEIDNFVISHASSALDLTEQETTSMYRPLVRIYEYSSYFNIPIHTNTALFDKDKNYYTKKNEIKSLLKKGDTVRAIISFRRIQFKDGQITIPFETIQLEMR